MIIHTRLLAAATIIALVVFISFVLSVPRARDVAETATPHAETVVPLVTLLDTFKKGLHTITGSVEAPNACTSVSAEASVTGEASSTQSILVAITMPADEGVCLQLPTRTTFQTTVEALAGLPLIVTVNGAVATTSAP